VVLSSAESPPLADPPLRDLLTFPHESQGKPGWTSLYHYGINLGPVVLMCENYRSGLLWQLTRRCPYLVTGLRRAGFANGWL
jgi:hypothetical protein